MAVARTVLGTVLAGAETSYKTGGTPTKDLGLIKTTVVNPDSGVSESHGFGQSNGVSVNAGAVNPKGSIECDLQHGRLLEYAIFGGTTTHVDSTLDCTHTMVWAEELKSYALEQSYEMGTTDIVMDMLGVIFGSSTISTSLDGNLKFRSDWTAGDISTSETAVTSAVVNPGAPLPGFMAGLNLGAGALTCVQNWEITLNKNSKNSEKIKFH